MIEQLYTQNSQLRTELERQVVVIDEADKFQKKRESIIADNKKLHKTVDKLESEYQEKYKILENEFKDKSIDLEYKYKSRIFKLEKENNRLYRVIDKFQETIKKFIKWICKRFALPSEDEIIRDFEKETNTFINAEKQVAKEDRDKEFDLER